MRLASRGRPFRTARATSYPRANERVGEEELEFIEDGGAIVDHLRSSSSESSSSSSGKK